MVFIKCAVGESDSADWTPPVRAGAPSRHAPLENGKVAVASVQRCVNPVTVRTSDAFRLLLL